MRAVIFLITIVCVFLSFSQVRAQSTPKTEVVYGKIIEIVEEEAPEGLEVKVLNYTVRIKENGEEREIESVISTLPDFQSNGYQVGDEVVVNRIETFDGNITYRIVDYIRTTPMLVLFIFFVIVTTIVARKKGVFSLVGLVISFLVIFWFILPNILGGNNPLLVTIGGAIIVIPINFSLSHGFNRKTAYAALSTLITLCLTGVLAIIFVNWAKLTGFTSDEAGFLQALTNGLINVKDLLISGIIIGVLGILDDITISQASIANQLKAANPKIKFEELFFRTMEVGKDHIASLVNTLVLVYTSTSMPLLLLFLNANDTFYNTINREVIAQEVIQILIASIGLIIAVPISTLISSYFFSKFDSLEIADASYHHH